MGNSEVFKKDVPAVARLAIAGIWASLVLGQTVRLPLEGQGGGILLSDIAVAVFLLVAGMLVVVGRTDIARPKHGVAWLAVAPFLLWGLSVALARYGTLGTEEITITLLYWLRLAAILAVFPVTILLFYTKEAKNSAFRYIVYAYIALLALGYVQIVFFPSLSGGNTGWDPHQSRMFATWLDPNFFGAFLGMFLPLVFLRTKSSVVLLFGIGAIVLTASRSVYIATLCALAVSGTLWLAISSIPKAWKKPMAYIGVNVLLVVILGAAMLGERATKFFVNDPTVALRADAYEATWKHLVEEYAIVGAGYNAYQFAARDAGLISDFTMHSRSGSDSSMLTLFVTTGIIGVGLFFAPIVFGIFWHAQKWLFIQQYSSLWFIWATVFLLVHSQFANSLLYPHILLSYLIAAALLL